MGLVAPQSNNSLVLISFPFNRSLALKYSLSPCKGLFDFKISLDPVLPNPCVPLSVRLRDSTSFVSGFLIRSRISCAIRSPLLTWKSHRQLLPRTWFLKSFLDTYYSFRVLALRPAFTGPVLCQESPGALGFWVSPYFIELFTSGCREQSLPSSLGNIFLSLGLKFRFGLVWWHGLGSESPVPCVSHGPLGG